MYFYRLYIFIPLISFVFSCNSQIKTDQSAQDAQDEQQYEVVDTEGDPYLLGEVNQAILEKETCTEWFNESIDEYEPKEEVIEELKTYLPAFTIDVFFGTWCSDSQQHIPAFYKILEKTAFPMENLHSYAVGDEGDFYKKTQKGDEEGKDITHVPTFIFYKDGVEVNRIVESIMGTRLEDDILNIVSGKEYHHAYDF